LRHSRAARDGFECKQHPVRLEGFALAHGKEKTPAPADQLADRGLDRAAGLSQLIDLGIEWGWQCRTLHHARLRQRIEPIRQERGTDVVEAFAEIAKISRDISRSQR
jgi:hypothetical protein